jgi:hypothetical protein
MMNPRDDPINTLRKQLQYALDALAEMDRQQAKLDALLAENPEAAGSYQNRQWQETINHTREESRISKLLCEESLARRLLLADQAADNS